MKNCDKRAQGVSPWTDLSVHSRRFAEVIRLEVEIGYIHPGGILPLPFPRSSRNAPLVARSGGGAPLGTEPRLDQVSSVFRAKFGACLVAQEAVMGALQTQNRNRTRFLPGTGSCHRGRIRRSSRCSGNFLPLLEALVSHAAVADAATM